jgi:hypothetical protein
MTEFGSSPPGQSGVTEQAQEKLGQATETAQAKAQEATQQAKGRLREQVDQRSTQAGDQLTTHAQDIRSISEQLREQGKDQPAKLAEQAADRVERMGGYLAEKDADTILSDVEDLARRNPMAVVAGGIALGFVAARFLKASSEQRTSLRTGTGTGTYGSGAPQGYSIPPAQVGAGALPPASPAAPVTPAGTTYGNGHSTRFARPEDEAAQADGEQDGLRHGLAGGV